MATFTLFDEAINNIGKNLIDLDSHTFKVALTNTAPSAGGSAVLADITQISAGNGYSTGGTAAGATWSETSSGSGVWRFTTTDVVFTGSGGSINTHRYGVWYSDTATNDELLGYVDRGSSDVIADGASRTWDIGASGLFEVTKTP
jgi:hypothetical protein